MNKINILPSTLANKIAAGEVVERPSSVVKELLENSIDAKSTNIKILIREFGIKEIRIIDNGTGISNDDIERAFMRHATSKIKTDYDLFHINTLGFRGEALASIASVSEVEIKSCSGEEQGKLLELSGGKITKNEYYPPIKGTDITIKNLFYNTPARLKYLKNQHTEQASIVNVVHKLALAYPHIAFELIVDDKVSLKTHGNNDRHKVISQVYNISVAKNMLEFTGSNDDYEVSGYISSPEETRASKNYITIFINGRYIRNYAIQNSIIDAYGTFLMKNRYPLAVVDIKMDPVLLDANVHPTKQEVRLSKEVELIELLKKSISERLSKNTYIPDGINNVLRSKTDKDTEQISFKEEFDNKYVIQEEITEYRFDNNYHNIESNKNKVETNNFLDFLDINNKLESNDIKNYKNEIYNVDIKVDEPITNKKTLPQLIVLAQIFKTYILAQTGDELYLIDQHAAQERYNYEKFQNMLDDGKNYTKQLIVPVVLNFSVEEMANILQVREKLEQIGIILEEFGLNSYAVREYPIWIEEDIENTIKVIINKFLKNKNISLVEVRDEAIAMASCKASIKANQYLTHTEMEKVINDLYSCNNPFTCPHGRPIISKMTKKDLEKMFKRIV